MNSEQEKAESLHTLFDKLFQDQFTHLCRISPGFKVLLLTFCIFTLKFIKHQMDCSKFKAGLEIHYSNSAWLN
jgi:hypothetical protein